jgi:hypothetical protein
MLDPHVFQRVRKNPAAVLSAVFLAFMVLTCVAGPFFMPSALGEPGPNQYAPPSWDHPFGTDLNGRDLLYRVLTGGRISLLVGLCGAVVSLFIGTAWGLVAGYAGGRTDADAARLRARRRAAELEAERQAAAGTVEKTYRLERRLPGVQLAVAFEHMAVAGELPGQGLDQIDRSMLSAGATNGNRDVTAVVFFEGWQPLV